MGDSLRLRGEFEPQRQFDSADNVVLTISQDFAMFNRVIANYCTEVTENVRFGNIQQLLWSDSDPRLDGITCLALG
jgi:hypothetical protein